MECARASYGLASAWHSLTRGQLYQLFELGFILDSSCKTIVLKAVSGWVAGLADSTIETAKLTGKRDNGYGDTKPSMSTSIIRIHQMVK